jgi:hypothetical protein
MSSRKERTLKENIVTGIGGDRRANQRYVTDLPLHYTVVRQGVVTGIGTGMALDMSSGGMAFACGEILQPGVFVEVSLEWPVVDQDGPMEVVLFGKVVRSDAHSTAIRTEHHRFRRRQTDMWVGLPMAAGFC